MNRLLLSACLAGVCLPGVAQNNFNTAALLPVSMPAYSSSAAPAAAPAAADPLPEAPMAKSTRAATAAAGTPPVMPFSALGIQFKVGISGPGIDLATPLMRKLNLRGGVTYLNLNNISSTTQDVDWNGTMKLGTANLGIDFFPWAGAFHITPGVVLYNRNTASALLNVPAGQSITLNGQDYQSSATDPVHGTMQLTLDHKTAPTLSIGWGNMIPRKGGHWSLPVEVGVMATHSQPQIALTIAGTACSSDGCGNVATDKETQANLAAEQVKLNNDLSPLRFYPIVSVGFSYSFGRRGSGVR